MSHERLINHAVKEGAKKLVVSIRKDKSDFVAFCEFVRLSTDDSDFEGQVLRLAAKHGEPKIKKISDLIEELLKQLGVTYEVLQTELREQLSD